PENHHRGAMVSSEARGFSPTQALFAAVAAWLCVVGPGCSGSGTDCMEGAGGVNVTVLDPTGNPICDADVSAVSTDYDGPIQFVPANTSTGTCYYRSHNGSSGTQYDVTVSAPGFESNTADGVSAPPANNCPHTATVTVVLTPATP
ncbi:MAG: carboxypeptidase-like regulatory domain-containing protein, partial [Polyangiaceae bacterium]